MSELDKAQPEANLISASTSTIFLRLGLGLADGSSDYLGLLLKIVGPKWRFSPPPGHANNSMLAGSARRPITPRALDRPTHRSSASRGTVSAFIVTDVVCVSEGLFP